MLIQVVTPPIVIGGRDERPWVATCKTFIPWLCG